MRQARLRAPNEDETAYYHCVSRVVNRDFVFGDAEREEFVRLMRLYERFCGVRVLTYCVMSNHFHVLVGVPPRPTQLPDDGQLLAMAKPVYSAQQFAELEFRLAALRRARASADAEELRAAVMRRMWDVSAFMKALKQRFSGWFNRRTKRRGTLWEERFKSVLVEAGDALVTMAAYIDLNPLRAGIVADPAKYRWSGYASALAGKKDSIRGLREVVETWSRERLPGQRALRRYREVLYGTGEERSAGPDGERGRRGFNAKRVEEVLASGGALKRSELLRCRVRHFVDGAVLGSGKFIEKVFRKERHRFGKKRRKGAKPLPGVEGLKTLRDLREDAIIPLDTCK